MALSTLLVAPRALTGTAPTTSSTRRGPYVGVDRRRGLVPVEHVTARHVLLPSALLVVASLGALLLAAAGVRLPAAVDGTGVARLVETASAVIGTVVVMLAFVRWRLTGEATPLWVGTAVAVLTMFVTGLGSLVPVVFPGAVDIPVLAVLAPAGGAVAIAVLALGALGPDVDTRLHPAAMVTVVTAATASVAAFLVVPPLADLVRSAGGSAVLAVAWVGVAALLARAALVRQRLDLAPVAAMALGFGLARIVVAVTAGAEEPAIALPGPAVLRLLALSVLLVGARRSLEEGFVRQRAQLFQSTLEVETLHARSQGEHHAREERLHDAKNALLAIDGAAQTLERFRDRLSAQDRDMLSAGLSLEIQRLQRLIASDRGRSGDCVTADLHEVLDPVVTTERVRGLGVDYEPPVGLDARCCPTDLAEVVRALLDNARRHAPGSPVTVSAAAEGDRAVVYVEDRGPGVPRAQRASIFERGEGRDRAEGSAIGLFVSRRLMLDQGGDVWVEDRPGGGARFGVCVPLATDAAPAGDRV